MKDVIYLLFHLLTALAKLFQPGGSRAVIAENLLLKQQLIIHSRARQRAPNLTTQERTLLGFFSLLMNPRRIVRSAIIIKPSTLLSFHDAQKKRKYRLLYSPGGGRKPGPKGPSKEIIDAIVSMKQRNPRFGCPRIAQQINLAFGLELDKDTVRRVLATHYKPDPISMVQYSVQLLGQIWMQFNKYANNRAEQSHEPTRVRERGMRWSDISEFKSVRQAQRFVTAHAAVSTLFNLGRHLVPAQRYRDLRVSAFAEWSRAVA